MLRFISLGADWTRGPSSPAASYRSAGSVFFLLNFFPPILCQMLWESISSPCPHYSISPDLVLLNIAKICFISNSLEPQDGSKQQDSQAESRPSSSTGVAHTPPPPLTADMCPLEPHNWHLSASSPKKFLWVKQLCRLDLACGLFV